MTSKLLKIVAVVFITAFSLGFAVGAVTEFSLATSQKVVSEVYTVKQGDTFMDVCAEYRKRDSRDPYIFEYMDEIRELNPFLKDAKNQLQVGDEIVFQYKVTCN